MSPQAALKASDVLKCSDLGRNLLSHQLAKEMKAVVPNLEEERMGLDVLSLTFEGEVSPLSLLLAILAILAILSEKINP